MPKKPAKTKSDGSREKDSSDTARKSSERRKKKSRDSVSEKSKGKNKPSKSKTSGTSKGKKKPGKSEKSGKSKGKKKPRKSEKSKSKVLESGSEGDSSASSLKKGNKSKKERVKFVDSDVSQTSERPSKGKRGKKKAAPEVSSTNLLVSETSLDEAQTDTPPDGKKKPKPAKQHGAEDSETKTADPIHSGDGDSRPVMVLPASDSRCAVPVPAKIATEQIVVLSSSSLPAAGSEVLVPGSKTRLSSEKPAVSTIIQEPEVTAVCRGLKSGVVQERRFSLIDAVPVECGPKTEVRPGGPPLPDGCIPRDSLLVEKTARERASRGYFVPTRSYQDENDRCALAPSDSQWQPNIPIRKVPLPLCSDRQSAGPVSENNLGPYCPIVPAATIHEEQEIDSCKCVVVKEEVCALHRPIKCAPARYSWVPIHLPGEPIPVAPARSKEPRPVLKEQATPLAIPERLECEPCPRPKPSLCELKKKIVGKLHEIDCVRTEICSLCEESTNLRDVLEEKQCCFDELVVKHIKIGGTLAREFNIQEEARKFLSKDEKEEQEGHEAAESDSKVQISLRDRHIYHIQKLAHEDFKLLEGFTTIHETLMYDKIKTLKVWHEVAQKYGRRTDCMRDSQQKAKQAFNAATAKYLRIKTIREQAANDFELLKEDSERELQRSAMEDQMDRQDDQTMVSRYKEQLQAWLIARDAKYEIVLDGKDDLVNCMKELIQDLYTKHLLLSATGMDAVQTLDQINAIGEIRKLGHDTTKLLAALPPDKDYVGHLEAIQKLLAEYVACMKELESRRDLLLKQRTDIVGSTGAGLVSSKEDPEENSICKCPCPAVY